MYMLVDYDPDGLAILSGYKHGSLNLSHENTNLLPNIRWLGVRSRDIRDNLVGDEAGLLKLTARDRKRAIGMLERNEAHHTVEGEDEWRREMQIMLMLGVKAEMEILERKARMGDVIARALEGVAGGS